MKTAVVLWLSLAAVSCAQDKKVDNKSGENQAQAGTQDKKRLESVTWDLKNHKLIWVVQKGGEQNGEFVAKSSDRYEISPDEAVMAFANQKRGFTKEEASSLHKLLDTLSLYCAESVIWWDQGEGEPLDGTTPDGKNRHRVQEQPRKPKQPEPPAGKVLVAFRPEDK